MTDYTWLGTTGTSANVAANWSPAAVPTTGDRVIFDLSATQGCTWDIPMPVSALTVDEVIIEDSFIYTLTLVNDLRTKALFLNGAIAGTGQAIEFEHGASPNYFGTYKSFGTRFVMVGDSASYSGTIEFAMTASTATTFDDGQHGTSLVLVGGDFGPDYAAPTGTLGYAYFPDLTIQSAATWSPTTDMDDQDRLKAFRIDAFDVSIPLFDGGMATYEFLATSGGFQIPVDYSATYNNGDFICNIRSMKFYANTAGHRVILPDNRYLSLEELTIGDGVLLKGPVDSDDQGSDIRLTKPPTIRGSWSFSQISPGLYRSPRTALGPTDYVTGLVGLEFDTTRETDVSIAGEVRWDENEQTLAVGTVNGIHAHVGQTFQWSVKNQTGSPLTKGTVVMAVGSVGASGKILIDAMDASGTGDAKVLVGILQENVLTGGDSAALALGRIKGIDLTALKPVSETWADGDILYCDQANAGGLTNVAPSSGIILPIGFIIHYAANGSLAVRALPIDEGATGGGGGSGTVTSVAATVPTGFTISGSPITTSGTLALAYDTGYSLPTTAKQGQWDTAYGWGDHAGLYEVAGAIATHEATFNHAAFLTSESDPVFGASPAASITNAGSGLVTTSAERTNWNAAFGWGDHAAAGYLTSAPAPDLLLLDSNGVSMTAGSKASWNTLTNFFVRTSSGTAPTYNAPLGQITINAAGTYEMILSIVFRNASAGWGLVWSSSYTNYTRIWVTRGATTELGPVQMAYSSSMPNTLVRVLDLQVGDIITPVVYWNMPFSSMLCYENAGTIANFNNYCAIRKVS